MSFWRWVVGLLSGRTAEPARLPADFRIEISHQCMNEIQVCIRADLIRRHEGVCYLLGRTDGPTAKILAAIRPEAVTTPGSFHVDSVAMATVVRAAARQHLQVIGQLHTHPGAAYHSEGDEIGARIRYKGYISIVLPNYGRYLPDLKGAAVFVYQPGVGFLAVPLPRVRIAQDGWYA